MNSGNILSVNIANGVSILIMAVVGGFLLNAGRKFAAKQRAAQANMTTAAVQ